MRRRETVSLLCVALVSAAALGAQAPVKNAKARKKRRPSPAFSPIQDVAGLPRVLLVGDSISIGYTIPTRKLLEGKANVHRPIANCGPTSRGLQSIGKWLTDERLGNGKWDLIHFNWGIHDLKIMKNGTHQVPPDQYEKNLRLLVEKLKATGAKLIWASTTPLPEGIARLQSKDAIAYNAMAKKIMAENGIPIDDLHAYALPKLEQIQRPKNCHFTSEGSKVLAQQVAAAIEAELSK